MSRFYSRSFCDQRGVAAIEFALVAPLLLLLLGGVADFGLMMSGKSRLANGLAQGVQYALLTGPSVSAADMRTAVQNAAARSGVTSTVAVVVMGPACYCVSGSPAALAATSTALSEAYTCTGTCPVTGLAPNPYLIVTASYVYQPLMPFYSQLATATVSEQLTFRFK